MGLRITIYYVLFIGCIHAFSQTKNYEEAAYLSLNTTNVLVGEELHFSAFVYSTASKMPSKLSSVLYVDMIDESGNSVYRTKIGLRNGRGAGSIYINSTLLNGTYRLIAFTRWMKNYDAYFEQRVLVFNPHSVITTNESITGNPTYVDVKNAQIVEQFAPLQKASIILDDIEKSSLSISISKTNSHHYLNSISLADPDSDMDSFDFLPEYRYGMVQGQIENDLDSVHNLRVNMTIKGSSMQVSTTTTDEQGRFWMSYNPALVGNEGNIQVNNPEVNRIKIVNEYYENYSALNAGKVNIDSVTADELRNRSVITQIQRAYQLENENDKPSRQNFTGLESQMYYLEDYVRFPSIRDTFIEYITTVAVSKSEDNFKMNVRCFPLPGQTTTEYPALVLLDGMMVEPEDIFELSPNDVEKIEVLADFYFLNDMVYKGIVSVHTLERSDYKFTPKGTILKLASYQKYGSEGYKMNVLEERMPLYEPFIYWDPVYDHNGGPLALDFYTSRLEGLFEVTIRGISKSGKAINLLKYIKVESTDF